MAFTVQEQYALSLADKPAGSVYADAGQWSLAAFRLTGETRYARDAITRGLASVTREPANRNETREHTIEQAKRFDKLVGHMTTAERDQWCARLYYRADLILNKVPGKPWGTSLADSDETVGHYFGLLAIAKATAGYHPRSATLVSEIPATWRQKIDEYCVMARGGEYIESAKYNKGSLQLLFMGADYVGIEQYPEIAALAVECAEQILWQMTPDYRDESEWGDEETPGNPDIEKRVALASILAGVTGKLRGYITRLTEGREPKEYELHLYRALEFHDFAPGISTEAYGLKVADGAGLVLFRQPTQLHHIHFPRPLTVHHHVSYVADVCWWLNGEWVLDNPTGYSENQRGTNGPCFSGILASAGWQPRERGLVGAETTHSGGYRVVGRASGPLTRDGYYQPPTPFLTAYQRQVEYDGRNVLAITDDFEGLDPLADGMRSDRYLSMLPLLQARYALWETYLHCPVEPEPTATGWRWTTKGGQPVKLDATGHEKTTFVKASGFVGGHYHAGQLDGWVIRFGSDALAARITLAITVGVPDPPAPEWGDPEVFESETTRVTVQRRV